VPLIGTTASAMRSLPRSRTFVIPGNAPLIAAIGLGLVTRAMPVAASAFPLGDGALFLTMASNLRAAAFIPPVMSSYNGGVPFAYPPVSIYLLASWPGDLLVAERVLPVIISTALIPAVWLLARSLVGRDAANAAAFAFAFTPSGWALQGGDVPRGLWLLFAVLATWQTVEACRRRTARSALVPGLLAGLACATHPAAPAVMTVSLVAAWLLSGTPWKRTWPVVLLIAGIATAITGSWVAYVGVRYGLGTLVTAAMSHYTSPLALRLLAFGSTDLGLDLITGAALVGFVWLTAARQWFVPVWMLALFVVPGSDLRVLAVPTAMLVGIAWARVVLPSAGALSRKAVLGLTISAVALAFLAATIAPLTSHPLHALSAADRGVMAWVARNMPDDATFAVLTPRDDDAAAEWFPLLAGRKSITTYQGQEWVGHREWTDPVHAAISLRQCETLECVRPSGARYLYLSQDCCPVLAASLPATAVLHSDGDVIVARIQGGR
jgi:uncharacterized membrane protein